VRHQKLVEFAPARGMHPALRARLAAFAVALGKACSFLGAGTVEFLVQVGACNGPAARPCWRVQRLSAGARDRS
jgi:hypothetical protein